MLFTVITTNSLDESKLIVSHFDLESDAQLPEAIRTIGKYPEQAIAIEGKHYPINLLTE